MSLKRDDDSVSAQGNAESSDAVHAYIEVLGHKYRQAKNTVTVFPCYVKRLVFFRLRGSFAKRALAPSQLLRHLSYLGFASQPGQRPVCVSWNWVQNA
jgi:hypothetical protein